MKLTVRRQDLAQELALSQGVVEPKATIPILSHVLLRADREGLEILATDLEIGLRTRCAADVSKPGAATLPAKKLFDVVRALGSDLVSFEAEGNHWLKVEGGSFKGRVVGLPEGEFPTQPEPPRSAPAVKLPTSLLQQMVARVLFAVTTENTRFSINGALLKITPGTLTLVATDGHRLAHVTRPIDMPEVKSEISVLVPRKALVELGRMRPEDENEELELTAAGNHVFFRGPKRLLFSRTLEGSFPAYERVIPAENPVGVYLERRALLDVISRVATLTSDAMRLVTFHFTPGSLTVSTNNPSMGEASESMPTEHEGGEVKIGLNHEYVQQFLQAADTEKVEVRLKDSSTQALFKPMGGASTYQYVVMPMRLS